MGICVLLTAALLTLAINQAVRLASLYSVSASGGDASRTGWPGKLVAGPGSELLIVTAIATVLFLTVFRQPRRLAVTSTIALVLFSSLNLFSGRHLLPRVLVWPTPVALSERYVDALAASDLDAALRLTDRSEKCEAIMREVFETHQAQFRQRLGETWPEARGRSTSVKAVTTFYDKPLPQQIVPLPLPVPQELATVVVATGNGRTMWLDLKESYQPFLGTRYICGQGIDS
jgi:hypothetical protein